MVQPARWLTLVLVLLPSMTRAQVTEKEWTAVLLLSAGYETMQEKLSWSGSSAQVNVVVLHDQDGQGMVAYEMLPDTVVGHPPGDCCPGEIQPCCGHRDIDLGAAGIDPGNTIGDYGVLEAFFALVAERYPARHYLVSARGQAGGPVVLEGNWGGGLTVAQFVDALSGFTGTIGRKIDVLNFGFCMSGSADFAFALSEIADYYSGTPNFSNEPVAARWRFYRWVRTLIANPATTPRALAASIPEVFAEETPDCLAAPHQCTNTNPPNPNPYYGQDEPWTSSAVDLSQMAAVASRSRDLVCSLLANFVDYESDVADAIDAAAFYGWVGEYQYRRADLAYFAVQLGDRLPVPAVQTAAQGVVDAVHAAVVGNRFQAGGWFDGGQAQGLSAFVGQGPFLEEYLTAYYGEYPAAAMWRLLLETNDGRPEPTVTDLAIDPAPITLEVGQSITVTARAVSLEYGPMCAASVDWDTSGLVNVGELDGSGNPTTFRALVAGQGVLVANFGAMSAEAAITVTPATPGPGPDPTPTPQDVELDAGCACSAPAAPFGAAFGLLAVRWRRRRRPAR